MAYTPIYTVTSHLLRLIENISSLRSKIVSAPISVAWIPKLSKEAFSKMAHSSTAIEGNPLTIKEVKILAEGGNLPHAKLSYVKEIFNYFAALRYISKNANRKTISESDVFKLHSIIGRDVLDRGPLGKYRNFQVYVGNHMAPKADDVPYLMSDLLEWLNRNAKTLPAVFTSAITHYQFEFIHPFGDGNGRVGRALATWELFRRNFDAYHILAVDEVFWENRMRYYSALDNVRKEKGDLTGWLEFIAEAVELTLERAWMKIEAVKKLKPSENILELSPKQEKLLHLLRDSPLSINEIQKELNVTKPGAHFILRPLIDNNIVKRIGGYKSGKYTLS